jgi:transcriptional regulator with XRE-family HTH domain
MVNFVQQSKGGVMMGYRIKEIRNEKGMSQEELSVKSGISRTIISGLESGTRANTSAGTLLKIADALGVGVEEIFFTQRVQHGKQ